jgi:integrase
MATISKHGTKWKAQIRRRGLGCATRSFIKKSDAEKWARETEAAMERGEFEATPEAATSDPKQVTLGELVERYRDEKANQKKGSRSETYILNAFLKHSMAKKTLLDVKAMDWNRYRDERLKEIKAVSLKRQLLIFQHMYEVARDEWGFTKLENPLLKVKLEFVDQKRDRTLKGDEWERIIADAKTRKNPLVLQVIMWAKETGMRRGEILAMRWSDVNLKDRSLLIPETKNGHSRTLPVTKPMMALLEAQEPENELVFPIATANFDSTWKRILAKQGLSGDLRFHDLRHTAITGFFEKGLNVIEAASLSGHKTLKMLQRYSHPSAASILRKLEPVA